MFKILVILQKQFKSIVNLLFLQYSKQKLILQIFLYQTQTIGEIQLQQILQEYCSNIKCQTLLDSLGMASTLVLNIAILSEMKLIMNHVSILLIEKTEKNVICQEKVFNGLNLMIYMNTEHFQWMILYFMIICLKESFNQVQIYLF